VISGKRLNPFWGNAAADYTRVLYNGNEIEDSKIFSSLYRERLMGFQTTKTFTTEKREGNPHTRFVWIREYDQGLQSMGLPNLGIYNIPLGEYNTPTIVSYTAKSKEEAKLMTNHVTENAKKNSNLIALEYNLACPNVPGCPSCYKEDSLEHLKIVRENTKLPVFAKIGYFVEEDRIIDFGKKLENLGINGVTAINSPPGMGIDTENKKTLTAKKYAGVFGKGLKPLALRTVNILYENTDLELIGLGGIYKYSDALEFLMAGAKAVELCSALISKAFPRDNETECDKKIVESKLKSFLREFKIGTHNFMERKGFKSLSEIIGKLEKQ
jgi:dihydroorotate dehydrogenase (NAD+) catalytic subunit